VWHPNQKIAVVLGIHSVSACTEFHQLTTSEQIFLIMKIAIIGSGNVGGALAQQWIKAGHSVLIGAKFPLSDKNIQLAAKIS
jgi:glutamate dehydrogenase/leucine dehydrogenase